jgi:hypothetical protein
VVRENRRLLGWLLAALVIVGWVLLFKLGSLVGGLSRSELTAASAPVGWHGLYHQPLDLPLKLIRSVAFVVFPNHGQTITRLPNVLFGALAIISFGGLVRLWHGRRTAVLATAMFATGAWTLHVSRLASFDVLYLWAMPTLVCSHYLLRKYYQKTLVWYGNIIVWGLLLYVPGLIWLVLADIVLQRQTLHNGWKQHKRWWQRVFAVLFGLIWLPLLAYNLTRSGQLLTWLGLPQHLAAPATLLKQFVAIPVHLFIRGPQYPELWLGRAPILDIFALAACVLGIYFYATRWKTPRSRYLALLAVVSFILVGLGGPVGLSLLVPLLYMAVATGLAYLLHDWLKTFPNNPLARGLGIGLVMFAVVLSCAYNYRAYFIAWPHTAVTKATFRYHR